MQAKIFVNYYEVLEVDPACSAEAIEHRFRHLARRYHPDNQTTGDRARFDAVVEAHQILRDTIKRAKYHEDHPHNLPPLPETVTEAAGDESDSSAEAGGDGFGIDRDISIQDNILRLLYLRRRRNIREPGIGNHELEQLSGCPPEHLEFHIWYLKAKGWIARGDDGLLAITIDGVDRAAALYRDQAARMITDQR